MLQPHIFLENLNTQNHEIQLTRRFFRLTIPNILSNITVPLVVLVDTGMLGHLDDIRFLAGVALAAILFEFVYWTFGFYRMSTTGMAAQAAGMNDRHGLYLILFRSLFLALVFAAIILVAQKLIAWVGFGLLSGTPEVEAAGRDYFFARIWGAPAALCNFVFLGWFLGREKSNYALYMTIVANVANVILDYIFLFVLDLAGFGAGLATMISQYLSLFVAILLFFKMKDYHFIKWSEIIHGRELGNMLRLNVDITIRTLGLISAFALFTNFSATMGVQILAANTVLLRILEFAAYFIDGAAFATESLGGNFYGQENVKLLKRLLRYALFVGELLALAIIAMLRLAPGPFYRLLTSHTDIIAIVRQFDIYVAIVLVFGAFAYIYDGFFIGLLQGRTLRDSMLASTLLLFLPVATAGLYWQNNDLLWLSMVMFMVGRASTLGYASWKFLRKVEAGPT